MSEKPILFNGASILAIRRGEKTQTRRIMKPQPWQLKSQAPGGSWAWSPDKKFVGCDVELITSKAAHAVWCGQYGSITMPELSPYGVPGDTLWVKEAWTLWSNATDLHTVSYAAEAEEGGATLTTHLVKCCRELKILGRRGKKTLLFMPREFSRITLRVLSIRVERVQDISAEDAMWEGIAMAHFPTSRLMIEALGNRSITGLTAIDEYAALWDSIHGAGAWERNDWTWVVEFEEVGK